MWTLATFCFVTALIPVAIVFGLFHLADLKQAKDIPAPVDDWVSSPELQSPE